MEEIGMFDAKTRFSEIARRVKETGQAVRITNRGEEMVDIAPIAFPSIRRRSRKQAFEALARCDKSCRKQASNRSRGTSRRAAADLQSNYHRFQRDPRLAICRGGGRMDRIDTLPSGARRSLAVAAGGCQRRSGQGTAKDTDDCPGDASTRITGGLGRRSDRRAAGSESDRPGSHCATPPAQRV